MNLKKIINKLLINFDLSLVKKSTYEKSYKQSIKLNTYRLADLINPKLLEKYYENINLSKSQLAQDLFVLSELAFKKMVFLSSLEQPMVFIYPIPIFWKKILVGMEFWLNQQKNGIKILL